MKSDTLSTFVILMLVLQVVSVALLWFLTVLSSESSGIFAVVLAANLIAFTVVLEAYRNPAYFEGKARPAPASQPTATPPAGEQPK